MSEFFAGGDSMRWGILLTVAALTAALVQYSALMRVDGVTPPKIDLVLTYKHLNTDKL